MIKERAQALLVMEVPVAMAHGKRIAELAAAHRVPSLFPTTIAGAGGVITFGTSVRDGYQLLPNLIDKILKGARPADLPVQVITRNQLIINQQAARQSGVTIPPEVLKRADQVVE
jgi:putative ABC transport system substrate-binding protein